MNFYMSRHNYDQTEIAGFVQEMADKITELEEENKKLQSVLNDSENEIQYCNDTIKELEQRIEELEKGSDI